MIVPLKTGGTQSRVRRISLSTLVLNSRDRQGSRFPAKKLRTKSRLAKPSRRFSSIVLQK